MQNGCYYTTELKFLTTYSTVYPKRFQGNFYNGFLSFDRQKVRQVTLGIFLPKFYGTLKKLEAHVCPA